MKVMADLQEPVFPYPSSSVMKPVCARSFDTSMACSLSVPTTTGKVYDLPSSATVAVSGMFHSRE
jgi:hypothetical protein